MTTKTGVDFLGHSGGDFAEYTDADDSLHPAENAKVADDTLSETQYFGFKIPSEEINGFGYVWAHPNLQVVTAGVMVYQGIKRETLACDIFDIRAYMSMQLLKSDLHDYSFANGYAHQCLEPMKRHRINYNDSFRKNSFDIELTAIMPPAMYQPRGHFEQAMRTTGVLTLGGKTHDVNFFAVRDRSWGKGRPEDVTPLPPMAWCTGVFDETFAFSVSAFDHPDLDPEWKGAFDLPVSHVLKGGWVFDKGKLLPIKSVRKRTTRNPHTLFPETVSMVFVDSEGTEYSLQGTALAVSHWPAWPNLRFPMAMARWECNGKTGYGDLQEAQWSDFVRKFIRS